jgi:hypothetical protein
MSTLRVNTIQDAAGSGTPTINGLAKAWVNFNGTGTVAIRASLNVSSITDNGTGLFRVNFINAMTDANYGMASNAGTGSTSGAGAVAIRTQATTYQDLYVFDTAGGASDYAINCVSIFR